MKKITPKRMMTYELRDEYYMNWVIVHFKDGSKKKVFFVGVETGIDTPGLRYTEDGLIYNTTGSLDYGDDYFPYSSIDYLELADPEKEKNSKYHDELKKQD